MLPVIQNLHDVWQNNRANKAVPEQQLSFSDIGNAILSTGPFYYYIIDFFDMSLSHVNPSIFDMHDLGSEKVTLNDVLETIHPEDLEFVVKAEEFLTRFFLEKVGREKLLNYKISYCYRSKMKNGQYVLLNHQAVMLTMDDQGGYGKSLNIHTRIDHISNLNTYKISLIGLNGEPSFMNLSLGSDGNNHFDHQFSKREIDIIKLIGTGLGNKEIGEKLFISNLTVKKHRANILAKSECKNMAELIKYCIVQGII